MAKEKKKEKKKESVERVAVSLLLKKEARNKEAVHTVQAAAAKLGLEPTTRGRVSLCFQTTPERFKELFGIEAKQVGAQDATDRDFGAPAGFQVESALPIPDALAAQTESISVEPPATRFAEQISTSSPSTESMSHGEKEEEDKDKDRPEKSGT